MDIKKINFIKENDQLEEIKDGYSGAMIYKIIRGKEKYFLKIFNYSFHSSSLEKIRKGLEIYKTLGINSMEILDSGKAEEKDYIIYNYIEGINLREYSNGFSIEEINQIGRKIGKQLLKLKNYENYNKSLFPIINLRKITDEVVTQFNVLLEIKESKEIIEKYFNNQDIKILKEKIMEYLNITEKSAKHLIHGDIKRANIMVSSKKEFYLVDCESIEIAPDIMNFRYQITWALFSREEKAFISGYLDGIYNNTRPLHFNKMALYCILLNFFEATYGKYKQGGLFKMEEYLIKSKDMFEKIKMMDLSVEFII